MIVKDESDKFDNGKNKELHKDYKELKEKGVLFAKKFSKKEGVSEAEARLNELINSGGPQGLLGKKLKKVAEDHFDKEYRENLRVLRERVVKSEPGINNQNAYGFTDLFAGVMMGDFVIVGELLRHTKIDVNIQDENGYTAFFAASIMGDLPMVKTLLTHPDTDVTLECKKGYPALSVAMNEHKRSTGDEKNDYASIIILIKERIRKKEG